MYIYIIYTPTCTCICRLYLIDPICGSEAEPVADAVQPGEPSVARDIVPLLPDVAREVEGYSRIE